jgi:hypothetical protein
MICRSVLPALAVTLASFTLAAGCAAPVEEESDSSGAAATTGAANTNPAAGTRLRDVRIVIATVDIATTSWIAGETSKVDGALVGDSLYRQRELYYRVQTAVDAGVLRPALVHYGLAFSEQSSVRAITDAFSKAVDASPVPVVLETSPGGSSDGTLYHHLALSDPPNMFVGVAISFKCADSRCAGLEISMEPEGFTGKTLPAAFHAAATMAVTREGITRREAYKATGALFDNVHFPTVQVSRADLPTKISLKDLLTSPARAREVAGAALVIAPDQEVKNDRGEVLPLPLDELKALVYKAALGAGGTPRG